MANSGSLWQLMATSRSLWQPWGAYGNLWLATLSTLATLGNFWQGMTDEVLISISNEELMTHH